jgi:hypothetical protein
MQRRKQEGDEMQHGEPWHARQHLTTLHQRLQPTACDATIPLHFKTTQWQAQDKEARLEGGRDARCSRQVCSPRATSSP